MPKISITDEDLVKYVLEAKRRAEEFRNAYTAQFDERVNAYNCKHPEEWEKKEKWQTRVFIPLEHKNVEVGTAMLGKMLFSQKDFFEIAGFNPEEDDLRESLKDFVVHLLQKGNFYNIAMLALKEACITSTSFLKTIDVSKDKNDFTLNFIPRTVYDVLIDPSVSMYWVNSRYKIDQFERDVSDIISNPLYEYGKKYFEDIKKNVYTNKNFAELNRKALEDVRDNPIDATYKPHFLLEFHGKVKDPVTQEDVDMIVTVCDDKFIIRRDELEEDEDAYDVIRVNPIPKQFYGTGLIGKDLDVQKLANGVINLWMDNWKLSAMKMMAVDPAGDVRWDTIRFEPAAIWQAAKTAVTPIDVGVAVDGLNALGILDQLSQETTGLTKTAQGASSPGADETLGEVQIKLARSDARFVNIAKFIEAEFLGRFIKKVVTYTIQNCPQPYVDKVMGFKEVERKIPIPVVGDIVQQAQNFVNKVFKIRRLDLEHIRNNYGKKGKEVALDFYPIGISRFSIKADEQARYKELLMGVLGNESLGMMFDVRKTIKRCFQRMGFDDISDLLKSDEEIEKILASIQEGQMAPPQSQGMPQGMQMPQQPQQQSTGMM